MPNNSNDNKYNNRGIKFPFDFTKDKLALVVGSMAILALLFATYNFFNKGSDISSSSTQRDNEKVVLKNDSNDVTNKDTKVKTSVPNNSTQTETQNTTWMATDYKSGDISGAKYTVKSGDTLWEIAEAVYGDGTQWTKLLNSNSADIGFLPSGQQALIVPGQVLVLP